MALTPEQLLALKVAILAETDGNFVGYRNAGATGAMADWYNEPSTFIVYRKAIQSSAIGPVLNYVAVSNLTTINRDRATTFVIMNPNTFDASSDVADYWDVTFSGTLGGQGANTRAALQALWRRAAKRGEKLFATGTGTTNSPGALVFEGNITNADIVAAISLI